MGKREGSPLRVWFRGRGNSFSVVLREGESSGRKRTEGEAAGGGGPAQAEFSQASSQAIGLLILEKRSQDAHGARVKRLGSKAAHTQS